MLKWKIKADNITNHHNIRIDFTLTEFIETHNLTWRFHVYESAKSRYHMIIRRYILTALELNLQTCH